MSSSNRAVMRLAKTIDYLLVASRAMSEKEPIVRVLSVMDGLNLALRMVFDNLQWAAKTGIYDGDEKKLGRLANRFWLYGLVMSIIRGFYRLHLSQQAAPNVRQALPSLPMSTILACAWLSTLLCCSSN